IVRDRGRLYDKWAMLPDARQRISSHYPGVSTPQYEVRFPGMGVVLFGKTGEGDTWFQMEAHSASGLDALLHVGDYVIHKMSKQNVGPMGLSPHSEKIGHEMVGDEDYTNLRRIFPDNPDCLIKW
ncbi:MAG: hypothetical protein PHW69_09800, partial [Elusimicrobiaceae bacterium]|nr:hypothetical protein [Elusimicrobiaceae bacterium]